MPEISKAYEPQSVEEKWYAEWLARDFFKADPNRVSETRPAYSIVIPPPNITGVLHMGHVLNNTIQDILARKARMDGKEVLWLPGTDHASIATHSVLERKLRKEEGITRYDLGREKFIERAWEWREKHGGIIIQQLKKLGCSCDWSRERFTMDPEYTRCVERVFVELYKKGLIYRGKRMVNWCPATRTALSDEEVVMKQQNGVMYYFKVEVAELPGTWLTIATTRPETIPGDTAVAVNPRDERYAHLIGKHVVRPLPIQIPGEQKLIPIVGDDAVDFEFGTGVLKVTPAHDKADFEIGQRHSLPAVDIMNPDGTMNALAGESLVGLDRFEARNVAAEHLRELKALVKEEPYQNNVGYSERADVPIEPRLSEQWFLKYPSVKEARSVVAQNIGERNWPSFITADEILAPKPKSKNEKMRFFPERWAKVYDHWMENIQDWCISRQLWWGHRVPVWSGDFNMLLAELRDLITTAKVAARLNGVPSEEINNAIIKINGEFTNAKEFERNDLNARQPCEVIVCTESQIFGQCLEGIGFTQDSDVLDTWFSSWLWPFATMGWPEKTDTLAKFYPTTDLVTGPDIIFFWVARMIMAGFEFMGGMPFRNVYFTGIIRDKQGRKMSKSLGNSPDPLDLIAKFGADALRFGVMRSAPLGQDVLFDEKNVELGRNFCTKLWNAARFRQMQGGGDGVAFPVEGEINPALLTSDDKWILLRLDTAIREVSAALDEYRFSDAAGGLYRFFWSEFCDWHLEASKAVLNSIDAARKANTLAVLDFVLAHTLRLMHPFLPFITEELWHGLGFSADLPDDQGGRTIMFTHWPQPPDDDFKRHYGLTADDERFAAAKHETVTLGRNLRSGFSIPSNKKVKFVLKAAAVLPAHDVEVLRILLNAESVALDAGYAPPKGTPTALTPLGELHMPLAGLIDTAAERVRLEKEIAKVEADREGTRRKLSNEAFVSNAPAAVVEEHRKRAADFEQRLAQLQKMLDALGG
jgi:valyl-tRNA synthetase